jgi:hypothetical protein
MPEYQKWKDYTWHCFHAMFKQAWDQVDRDDVFVQVVAVPNSDFSVGRDERVVAFGIWVLNEHSTLATKGKELPLSIWHSDIREWSSRRNFSDLRAQYDCSAHLDTNQTRADDYTRQFASKTRFLHDAYPRQLYLNTLATHPDWNGRGFATMNLHWGFKLAKKLSSPVTLIATPTGYGLYDYLGFRTIKNITIETLDGWGRGSLWFEVMDYSRYTILD